MDRPEKQLFPYSRKRITTLAFLAVILLLLALVLKTIIPAIAALFSVTLLAASLYFRYQGTAGTPDSMMYAFIFFLVRIWLGRKQRVTIDDRLL